VWRLVDPHRRWRGSAAARSDLSEGSGIAVGVEVALRPDPRATTVGTQALSLLRLSYNHKLSNIHFLVELVTSELFPSGHKAGPGIFFRMALSLS
jgi:hypothetical protein